MRLPSAIVVPTLCASLSVSAAFVPSHSTRSPTFGTASLSSHRAFTPTQSRRRRRRRPGSTSTSLRYDLSWDDSSSNPNNRRQQQQQQQEQQRLEDEQADVWSVLKNTQEWMKDILVDDSSPLASAAGEDPLSRQEVSYVCEVSSDQAMILANVFRKLKEAREVGDKLGQEEPADSASGDHSKNSLQKTQVLVIPANRGFTEDFHAFDRLVNAINTARSNSRDFITDESFAHLYKNEDWSVNVQCAHLHPKYGDAASASDGMDMYNLDNHATARRSPFPTIVVEVSAGKPAAPVSYTPPPPSSSRAPIEFFEDTRMTTESDPDITLDVVQQLEALFRKPSTIGSDAMFDKHAEDVGPSDTPMHKVQQWVSFNDEYFNAISSAFTTTEAKHVDEAFEFVFCNLAMQSDRFLNPMPSSNFSQAQTRQYIIMPEYMRSSAVSFGKFTDEVRNIVRALPDLENRVEVTMFHPEHVNEDLRSPEPTIVLQWLM